MYLSILKLAKVFSHLSRTSTPPPPPPPPPPLSPLVLKRHHHLHIVAGEQPRLTAQRALKPVLVDDSGQCDDVTLLKAQLSGVLWLKVIQGLAARLLCGYGRPGGRRERERAGQDGKEEWERETEKTQYELFESVQIMVGDGA